MSRLSYPIPEPWRVWAVAKLREYQTQLVHEAIFKGLATKRENARAVLHLANRIEKNRQKPADWPAIVKALYEIEQSQTRED